MKVTLRKFLEIVGTGLIEIYLADLYVEEWDEDYQEWFPKKVIDHIRRLQELDPYLDYEIVCFRQEILYGELDEQVIYVRKITEDAKGE